LSPVDLGKAAVLLGALLAVVTALLFSWALQKAVRKRFGALIFPMENRNGHILTVLRYVVAGREIEAEFLFQSGAAISTRMVITQDGAMPCESDSRR